MREFSYNIQQALSNGLRPDSRVPRNTPYLEHMKNAKPTEFGAVAPEAINTPVSGTVSTWPFPQLLRGERVTLLCDESSLSTVDESDWSTSSVTVYQGDNVGSTLTLATATTPWELVSFYDTWFLTSGNNFIWSIPSNDSDKVLGSTDLVVQAICQHGRRLVLGGLSGSWFNDSRWTDLFTLWRESQPKDRFTHEDMSIDTTWVVWGERGGGADDLPYHLLLCALGLRGTSAFDEVDALIWDAVEGGEIGMIPLEHPGGVRALRPFGANILAWGANGMSLLRAAENVYFEEDLEGVGIEGRGAVTGPKNRRYWVDNDGELWRYQLGEGPEREGFSEYLSGLSTIVMNYDPTEKDVWIADGTNCYVRSRTGLGGPMDTAPTSLWRDDSQALIGMVRDDQSTWPVELRSTPTDLNERGTKHITALQVAQENLRSMQGTAKWRQRDNLSYEPGPWRPANPNGVIFPTVSASDFKIELKGSDTGQNARVERIEVRYNAEDQSYRRGTKGTPTEG